MTNFATPVKFSVVAGYIFRQQYWLNDFGVNGAAAWRHRWIESFQIYLLAEHHDVDGLVGLGSFLLSQLVSPKEVGFDDQ